MAEHKPIVVYVAAGELEAQVIRSKLESAGIPAMIQSEAGGTFPFTVDKMGEFRILVPTGWEREAREVLESGSEAPNEPEP